MAKTKLKKPGDFIVPLDMNGLQGRMLHYPNKKKSRNILFVYGHHSSLERWWGVIEDLHQYGSVTMPDLPGFGGMESFYKIGSKPSIDNLADYLAAFIMLRFKRSRLTIVGLSFGFVVATRMLQRYPHLVKKVDLLVSVVGFARYDDFSFSKSRYRFYLNGARLFSKKLPSMFFRNVVLSPDVLRLAYARTHNAQEKFAGMTKDERKATMDFEIMLWHSNEVRTYMNTTKEFLTLDNCKKRVKLPLWHVSVANDRYFDSHRVIEHLKVIFEDVNVVYSQMESHAPSIIADKKTAYPMIPKELRAVLAK